MNPMIRLELDADGNVACGGFTPEADEWCRKHRIGIRVLVVKNIENEQWQRVTGELMEIRPSPIPDDVLWKLK